MVSSNVSKPNIIDVDLDAPLWRVFKPEYLLSSLERNELVLVKPSLWDDPFENFLSRVTLRHPSGKEFSAEPIVSDFYGLCWTNSSDETDATWRIYAPHHERGVRVRTTARKLFEVIYDPNDKLADLKAYIGTVTYIPETTIMNVTKFEEIVNDWIFDNSGVGQATALLIKRVEFLHESEVRLLYREIDKQRLKEPLRSFPIRAADLFDELVLDPRMSESEVQEWETRFRTAGYSGPVRHSTLYRVPEFTVNLRV